LDIIQVKGMTQVHNQPLTRLEHLKGFQRIFKLVSLHSQPMEKQEVTAARCGLLSDRQFHTGHGGSAFPKIAELSLQPVVGTAILVLTNRQVQVEVHIGTEDVKELAAHLFRKISGLGVFQPDHV
jgi:hypothetical protein